MFKPKADFDKFLSDLRANIPADQPIFTTEGDHYETYIDSFPFFDRQEYRCNCCKSFIRKYAGLVTIDEQGAVTPVLWQLGKDYGYFNPVVVAMNHAVRRSAVNGVFLTRDSVLGTPTAGGWTHLAVTAPAGASIGGYDPVNQVIAEKTENFSMVSRALNKFSEEVIQQGFQLLNTGFLPRSEIGLGPVKFLADLKEAIKCGNRENLIWKAVATAPNGFCHINSGMAGFLMETIEEDGNAEVVKRKWAEKVGGLAYQRPTTAPTAQNIARGEKIIEQAGYKPSLRRRHATMDDLRLIWAPKAEEQSSGVFGHLVPRSTKPDLDLNTPAVEMTFSKFARTILPTAEQILVHVPGKGQFSGLTTAVDPTAPGLFQWSNPVCWYLYSGGSTANRWNLTAASWVEVTGITPQPNMWENESPNTGEAIFFLLKGCYDTYDASLCLFPSTLKGDLHEIRKTIEAFSQAGKLEGRGPGNAAGLRLRDNSITVKVICKGVTTKYVLDRLE